MRPESSKVAKPPHTFFASTGSYDSGGPLKITKHDYAGNSFGGGAWHALTLILDLSRGIPTANANRPVNTACSISSLGRALITSVGYQNLSIKIK